MLDMLDLTATQLLENGPDYIVRSSFYMREVRPLRIVLYSHRSLSHLLLRLGTDSLLLKRTVNTLA